MTATELGGDLGRMLLGINHLLDMTDAFVRESQAVLQHAAEAKRRVRETPASDSRLTPAHSRWLMGCTKLRAAFKP